VIRKNGSRFSEKTTLNQNARAAPGTISFQRWREISDLRVPEQAIGFRFFSTLAAAAPILDTRKRRL
jgi:hypothetical protein